jgi:hypothetical protein
LSQKTKETASSEFSSICREQEKSKRGEFGREVGFPALIRK